MKTSDNKLNTMVGAFRMGEFEKNKVPGAQLLAIQSKYTHQLDYSNLNISATYYGFSHVEGKRLSNGKTNSITNSVNDNDLLTNSYQVASVSTKLNFDKLKVVPRVSLIGEYVQNMKVSENQSGYLIGLGFGDKKIKTDGQWQARALYRHLAKDAWLDIFPDSDAYSGNTGVKGFEFIAKYALTKNLSLCTDVYFMQNIEGPANLQSLAQVDLIVKF